jgi:hypothetical protein
MSRLVARALVVTVVLGLTLAAWSVGVPPVVAVVGGLAGVAWAVWATRRDRAGTA